MLSIKGVELLSGDGEGGLQGKLEGNQIIIHFIRDQGLAVIREQLDVLLDSIVDIEAGAPFPLALFVEELVGECLMPNPQTAPPPPPASPPARCTIL